QESGPRVPPAEGPDVPRPQLPKAQDAEGEGHAGGNGDDVAHRLPRREPVEEEQQQTDQEQRRREELAARRALVEQQRTEEEHPERGGVLEKDGVGAGGRLVRQDEE